MRCTATININGEEHQCDLNLGEAHWNNRSNPPASHSAKLTDSSGKSGIFVRWSTWRTVQPQ